MVVNCDIGERGADHPVDLKLIKLIKLANIACGGHAGDVESIRTFSDLAKSHNVMIAAHLSYPDRENFGRTTMVISRDDLYKTLDEQFALISGIVEVKRVKLHGAIYNDCNIDESLANFVIGWMEDAEIEEVVTPFYSALADAARKVGIKVFSEAFAERRYSRDSKSNRLVLVNRSKEYASIHNVNEAIAHSKKIIFDNKVTVHSEDVDGNLVKEEAKIEAQTICIHSDSEIALDLAKSLAAL